MQHISPTFFAQRETGRYDNMITGMGKPVFDGNFNGNVFNFLKTLKTVFVDKALRSPDQSHFYGPLQYRVSPPNLVDSDVHGPSAGS